MQWLAASYDLAFGIDDPDFLAPNANITRSLILLAADISAHDIRFIVLEEIVQSTGLLTDIDNEWYDTISIFAENSNLVIALRGQDVMALRRHYPLEK